MILFKSKLDPIIALKLKEKADRVIPAIIMFKEPPTNRLKNSISKNRGKLKYEYNYINSLAADLNIEEVDKLAELPEVFSISYDRKANICMDRTGPCVGLSFNSPYSLTGRNVNIAIIDTGVYPHADLTRPYKMVLAFKDFVNSIPEPYDDNGHGTHLCGVISGSGSLSEGKYKGIAQNSKIVMIKAFNSVGEGCFSHILASIGWIIENREKYNIKILCLPFGADAIVSYRKDPLCKACEAASNAGIIIVTAAGNKGSQEGTITTPGISPSAITVGCCECKDLNDRTWSIPVFSGRGSKKDDDIKPDLIAPGVNITSLSSDKTYNPSLGRKGLLLKSLDNPYSAMTGSSVSTAVAAGCVALLLEKNPGICIKDLKGVLKLSCKTLNEPKTSQGYGMINMEKLLK